MLYALLVIIVKQVIKREKKMDSKRNYDLEAIELKDKKYNYDFDGIVREYMFRTWEKYFTNDRVLEVGCYHGESTVYLNKYFSDLTVVEPSAECIKIASQRVKEPTIFVNDVIENFESSNRFKHIFLVNTLEHCESPELILIKLKSLLDIDGKLYILVPNANAPSRHLASFMKIVDYSTAVTDAEWMHGHRRTYSFDTLNHDVTKAGFKVIDRGGIIFKGLANYQFDLALKHEIINTDYIEACYELGKIYANQTASIYVIVTC